MDRGLDPAGEPRDRHALPRLRGWAAQPQRRAFTFLADGEAGGGPLDFGELDLRAQALAAKLQQDLSSRRTGLLLHPPGPDYIISFLGCLYAGCCPCPPIRRERSAGDAAQRHRHAIRARDRA